jgi:hypothetical protein
MVRNVALKLRQDSRIAWFHVEAVNQESIHNHAAFAQLSWDRFAEMVQPKHDTSSQREQRHEDAQAISL